MIAPAPIQHFHNFIVLIFFLPHEMLHFVLSVFSYDICFNLIPSNFTDVEFNLCFYRYLEYALDPSKISPRNLNYVMYYIADSNEKGANIAWNFFQLKWEKISKMWVYM